MCLYIDGDPSLFGSLLYISNVKGKNRTPTNKATDCSSAIKLLSPAKLREPQRVPCFILFNLPKEGIEPSPLKLQFSALPFELFKLGSRDPTDRTCSQLKD